MANLSEVAKNKLKQMRSLLSDKAVDKVLSDAEAREQAAQAVGLEFKEKSEKSGEPQKLSHILAGLDDALEAGTVVDDTSDEPEDKTPAPVMDTQALVKELAAAINTATKETVAAQFKEFLAALETKESVKPDDPKVLEVQTKMKAAEDEQKKLKAQLDELLGSQPKSANGFKASESTTTLVSPEDLKLKSGPGPDPLNEFVSDFVMGLKPANGSQP